MSVFLSVRKQTLSIFSNKTILQKQDMKIVKPAYIDTYTCMPALYQSAAYYFSTTKRNSSYLAFDRGELSHSNTYVGTQTIESPETNEYQ